MYGGAKGIACRCKATLIYPLIRSRLEVSAYVEGATTEVRGLLQRWLHHPVQYCLF